MVFPQPVTGGTARGTGPSRVGPTDVASARTVLIAALQSGTELPLIQAGTPSADVLTAIELLNGNTTDIGTSYLALINSTLGTSLASTDEWDDVRDAIDALGE
jgi:hypothetical protein